MFSGAAAARYPGDGRVYQPFFEAGVTAAPSLGFTFGLTYTTQTSSMVATGTTSGSYYGGYLRSGVLVAPTLDDKIVLSASLAADWLSTGSLSENPGGAGTFTVNQPAQTGLFNTVRVGADWTHQITPVASVTLTGALGRTFASSGVTSTIPGAGVFTTSGADENFFQYGARTTYGVTEAMNIGAFVFGTTGELSGTHLQVGGSARIRF